MTRVLAYATTVRMAANRFAALALMLCACAANAQQHVEATLTVIVMDQTGAVIPGARIFATREESGTLSEVTADAIGQASVHLNQGSYALKVDAIGFKTFIEKEIDLQGDLQKDVTLRVGNSQELSPCCFDVPLNPPVERQLLEAALPLMPMQRLAMSPKRLRARPRWF